MSWLIVGIKSSIYPSSPLFRLAAVSPAGLLNGLPVPYALHSWDGVPGEREGEGKGEEEGDGDKGGEQREEELVVLVVVVSPHSAERCSLQSLSARLLIIQVVQPSRPGPHACDVGVTSTQPQRKVKVTLQQ
ncbi:hypothetical protein L209DRAFT_740320 [Thermothelomyces heterothallicus CBS 203.75]